MNAPHVGMTGRIAACWLAVALGAVLGAGDAAQPEPLLCYVGGTMRPAMEQIAGDWEKKTGRKIQLDFADSGQQMIKVEQTGKGDLLVVHDPYPGLAVKKGLVDSTHLAAGLSPVIVVPKGNPKKVAGLADLAGPGMRVVLTDQRYSTLGHIVPVMLGRAGIKPEALDANVVNRPRSGGEAANAVIMGTADAAIVWNAIAFLRREKLDKVLVAPDHLPRPGVDTMTSATYGLADMSRTAVGVQVLGVSRNVQAARAFAAYAASAEARATWDSLGYAPAPMVARPSSEAGPDQPLLVYCAAGMRLPVEKMAQAFEKQDGVKLQLTFDGSNRLLGQIELVGKGDVYISGDAEYVQMAVAKGLVASSRALCHFVPVIMVRKGNPLGVKTLADLLKPGVKIGQGDERAAAVGRATLALLAKNTLDAAAWRKNVVTTTVTVNELGLAVKLGTIDAAVVWDAIAANFPQDGEAVAIPPEQNVVPEVEGAVLAFTRNQDRAAAFLDFIGSPAGRQILKDAGYTVKRP